MSKKVIEKSIQDKINDIVMMLKTTVVGECAIALAGAHAKGLADSNSDIDIFMFAHDFKPFEEREKIIRLFADQGTTPWLSESLNYPWGGSMDFAYKGTPIEVVVRYISQMDQRINECLEGKFEIIPQTWTSNGYYTYVYLSEVNFIKPIYDPNRLIESYKTKLRIYPPKLKTAIIECFLARAGTWIDNFHYHSAIKRKDLLFTSPIVLHTVLDAIQVIFALNEQYYNGDKKLEKALSELEYCPKKLLENIDILLNNERNSELMEKQYDILCDIFFELKAKTLDVL